MGWEDVARGTLKVINKFSGADDYSSKKECSESYKNPKKTSPEFHNERDIFDDFINSNAHRPLGECKEELLLLINSFIKKSYSMGGQNMREGLIQEFNKAGY